MHEHKTPAHGEGRASAAEHTKGKTLASTPQQIAFSPPIQRMPGDSIVQRKTEVKWTSQKFDYMDKATGNVKSEQVGKTMKATLDPSKPIKGGDARSSFQKDMYDSLKHYWNPGSKKWVRGHMLNANLGGPNVATNLFPITGHANGDHLNYVENHVKQWIIDGKKVQYNVTATQDGGTVSVGEKDGVPKASGTFACYAETEDGDDGKRVVNRVITSTPVKRNSAGGDSDDPGHASSWNKVDTEDESKKDNSKGKLIVVGVNDRQFKFVIAIQLALADNSLNLRSLLSLILKYQLGDSELAQIDPIFAKIRGDVQEETGDTETADTELEKVAHRVTNEQLTKWIGKKLTNSEASDWLESKKTGDNTYEVSS